VKYFSGTATYAKTLLAPDEWFEEGAELWLDLGDVKNLAEVLVNAESLGIVWTEPFQVNVSKALRPGENALEIRVTNLWVDRLIGDQQPDAVRKYTYTTQAFYRADSPLLPSGLLGPVQVLRLSMPQPRRLREARSLVSRSRPNPCRTVLSCEDTRRKGSLAAPGTRRPTRGGTRHPAVPVIGASSIRR
jgi:hypothetical protein